SPVPRDGRPEVPTVPAPAEVRTRGSPRTEGGPRGVRLHEVLARGGLRRSLRTSPGCRRDHGAGGGGSFGRPCSIGASGLAGPAVTGASGGTGSGIRGRRRTATRTTTTATAIPTTAIQTYQGSPRIVPAPPSVEGAV